MASSVPSSPTNGLSRSISCGFDPETGKFRFFNSAFKSLTFMSSRRDRGPLAENEDDSALPAPEFDAGRGAMAGDIAADAELAVAAGAATAAAITAVLAERMAVKLAGVASPGTAPLLLPLLLGGLLAGKMICGYLCCHSSCHWRKSCCCWSNSS